MALPVGGAASGQSMIRNHAASAGLTRLAISAPSLALNHGNVVLALQVDPELRAVANHRANRASGCQSHGSWIGKRDS
jgi:hypothetical protein